MKEILKLVPNSSNEETELEISTGYEIGGYNYFNGTTNQRGYYLYATPCTRSTRTDSNGQPYTTVTQTLGKGGKILLKAVSRSSKKAESEAETIALAKKEELVRAVCTKYGMELEFKYLSFCHDFSLLAEELTHEELMAIEKLIAEYKETPFEEYQKKYPSGYIPAILWYEGKMSTDYFLYKE